jgi:DnaJ like chaperone protein
MIFTMNFSSSIATGITILPYFRTICGLSGKNGLKPICSPAKARIAKHECQIMSVWGKIIGSAAGFAIGGPIGALFGALAGHAVDVTVEQDQGMPTDPADRSATRDVAFTIAAIALGAKMAKADGIVSRSEVDAFKEVFRVPPGEMKNVARIFDLAKRDSAGFETYARQVASLFTPKHPVLEEMLDGLFHIARADGVVHDTELNYLRRVAEIFGFGDGDFARIREINIGADKADPYTILGITRENSNDEIKAAWRQLVRDNHPDKLIAQGLPSDFIDLATDKLARINAAYDKVAKERGIS